MAAPSSWMQMIKKQNGDPTLVASNGPDGNYQEPTSMLGGDIPNSLFDADMPSGGAPKISVDDATNKIVMPSAPSGLPIKRYSETVTTKSRSPSGPREIDHTSALDLLARMNERSEAARDEQNAGVDSLQGQADEIKQMPNEVNLQPLFNISNELSGGDWGKGYKQPTSAKENKVLQMKLEEELQKRKGDISTQELANMKAQLEFLGKDKAANPLDDFVKMQRAQFFGDTNNRQQNGLDNRAHQQILNKMANDKPFQQRIGQSNNLDNALAIITDAKSLTPQQIHEFQQAIRGNLGIKGTSGVGEREETYFKSLGLSSENWKQFLSGNPAEIAKDSKLMNHLRDLASVEKRNIAGQMDSRLNAITGGRGSMYKRRPDLHDDLKSATSGYRDSYQAPGGAPKAGDVVDGHVFKGGDPADQASWEAK